MTFIVLDGPDGSGKSTQIDLLKNHLAKKNIQSTVVREPGGTALGEELRDVLLNRDYSICPKSESFLFNAARVQLINDVIQPALTQGNCVISDRFYPSTLVYQSIAGGQDFDQTKTLCDIAVESFQPDFIFILDVPVAITKQRISRCLDRIESKGTKFLEKVRSGFLELAHKHKWVILDATQSKDDVHNEILNHLDL